MSKVTRPKRKPKVVKPEKPHKDFPLFPHATRRWAKKVRGKLHYFGPWDKPQDALDLWLEQKDDLLAGRTPRVKRDGLIVRDLLNRFLTAKRHLVDTRELTERTWRDYHDCCERLGRQFGLNRLVDDLAADDFEALRATLAKVRGPVALGNEIQRVRTVFKYGYEAGLIDRPIRYGQQFKKPSKRTMRAARHARGNQMFEPTALRKLIDKAGIPLKAMVLLGINAGFGNGDCGTLPVTAVDLSGGWIDYPRPKTSVARRCPLWPETVRALKAAIAKRPTPKDAAHAELLFVTKYGASWAKSDTDNPISKAFRKLGDGPGFYSLRRTFETVAGESLDQIATDHIMGHSPDDRDMAAVYRQRVTDDRLKAVTDHVRGWLFSKKRKAK